LGAAQLCENDKGHGTGTDTGESEDACYEGEINGAMRLSSRRRDGRSGLTQRTCDDLAVIGTGKPSDCDNGS
jgi:hypothetical protein